MSQDHSGARRCDAAVATRGDARTDTRDARNDVRSDARGEPSPQPLSAPARIEPARPAEPTIASNNGGTSGGRQTPAGGSPSGGGGDGLRVNLEFDFPSDVNYIERVVAVVIRQCEEFSFPPRQCALNVPVALTEALSNAILRGNGDDRSKQVRVRAHVDQRALVMEVADEGQGFDYASSMRDPTAPENIAREDGRGLYLMQRLMDQVERFTDHGNVVRLTLKRG